MAVPEGRCYPGSFLCVTEALIWWVWISVGPGEPAVRPYDGVLYCEDF